MKTKLKQSIIYTSVFALGMLSAALISNVSAQKESDNFIDDEESDNVIDDEITKNTLDKNSAESLLSIIQTEGMHDAFTHYSTYRDIGDQNFHKLRLRYVAASDDLMQYIAEAENK
jgi:hypothetical protein